MKATLMTITPELAKSILDTKNKHNRPMNRHHVKALANEMTRGTWKVNGDTICLNGDRLIDGQHRLAAVIQSGVTIESFVIEGLPSDVFDTKDTGKRRSAADTLSVRGEANTKRLAAALVLIDKYFTGRVDRSVNYSNTEIEELLEKYPDARHSLRTDYKSNGLFIPSVLDACYYLFSQKDKAMAEEFVDKIYKGIGLHEDSPWYLLRERLVRNSMAKAQMDRTYMMALCIKAFNAARTKTRLKVLRWREQGHVEQFPVIL
jgi:hypothetical protein